LSVAFRLVPQLLTTVEDHPVPDYGLTVSVAVLLTMLPDVAVIEVVWALLTSCPVATPALEMVAALLFDDFHVTASVMSMWLPFCNMPIAVKDSV
jgi:hypothetical protein